MAKNKTKAKLDLNNKTAEDRVELGTKVSEGLNNNSSIFPTPDPKIADVVGVTQKLQAAIDEAEAARQVSITKTALLSQAIDNFDDVITKEANYVNNASDGDEAKIKAAGFNTRKKPEPVGIPARPENLSLAEGAKDGTLAAKWKPVRGARSYLIRYTTDIINQQWQKDPVVVTKAGGQISDLTSGQKYWAQVAAVGAAGTGPWSDPAVKVAP